MKPRFFSRSTRARSAAGEGGVVVTVRDDHSGVSRFAAFTEGTVDTPVTYWAGPSPVSYLIAWSEDGAEVIGEIETQ